MADKKKPTNWRSVKPGNIVSFRYKSKSGKVRVQTILVLNPRLPVTLKDGTKKRHLIGIKLEDNNKIKLRMTKKQVDVLEKIGDFLPIDEENNLYTLAIDNRFVLNDIKGVKQSAYDKISRSLNIKGQYRTYDYRTAKKSPVFLEPIRVFTKIEPDIPFEGQEPEEPKEVKEKPKKPKKTPKPKKTDEVKDEN